jgi:hypothetical protein
MHPAYARAEEEEKKDGIPAPFQRNRHSPSFFFFLFSSASSAIIIIGSIGLREDIEPYSAQCGISPRLPSDWGCATVILYFSCYSSSSSSSAAAAAGRQGLDSLRISAGVGARPR